MAAHLAGLGQQGHDLACHCGHVVHSRQVRQRHRELVAAEPAHGVPGANGSAQALGHDAQHLVTDVVAECVVDVLEAVQVHKQHRHRTLCALGVQQRLRQAVQVEVTVGQTGERVELRQAQQPFLGMATFQRGGQGVGDGLHEVGTGGVEAAGLAGICAQHTIGAAGAADERLDGRAHAMRGQDGRGAEARFQQEVIDANRLARAQRKTVLGFRHGIKAAVGDPRRLPARAGHVLQHPVVGRGLEQPAHFCLQAQLQQLDGLSHQFCRWRAFQRQLPEAGQQAVAQRLQLQPRIGLAVRGGVVQRDDDPFGTAKRQAAPAGDHGTPVTAAQAGLGLARAGVTGAGSTALIQHLGQQHRQPHAQHGTGSVVGVVDPQRGQVDQHDGLRRCLKHGLPAVALELGTRGHGFGIQRVQRNKG